MLKKLKVNLLIKEFSILNLQNSKNRNNDDFTNYFLLNEKKILTSQVSQHSAIDIIKNIKISCKMQAFYSIVELSLNFFEITTNIKKMFEQIWEKMKMKFENY